MKIFSKILFVFQGGTCGSFMKTLMWAAMGHRVTRYYDETLGHAHAYLTHCKIKHTHLNDVTKLQSLYPDHDIILITYEDDDLDVIANMHNGKYLLPDFFSPGGLEKYLGIFPVLKGAVIDEFSNIVNKEVLNDIFKHITFSGYPHWITEELVARADLIFTFKEIMYGPPEYIIEKISNYLGHPPRTSGLESVINEYRKINKQYIPS